MAAIGVPGFAAVRELPEGRMRETGDAPPDSDATVFCVHECHRVPQEDLESGGRSVTVTCPRCGAVQMFPGFVDVEIFACQICGEMVEVGGGPVQ
jgi:hypothetical protein